jgi:glycosyltransferase involved in cell wall biosynthesis
MPQERPNRPNSGRSVARYYRGARTVHLERLATFEPGDFLYYKPMYDFDNALADALPHVSRVRFSQVLWRVLSKRYGMLELAEPYTPSALPQNLAIVAASYISAFLPTRRPPTRLVTYAIENADLAQKLSAQTRVPAALTGLAVRTLVGFCFARFDRVAFGTAAAMDNYRALLGERRFSSVPPARTLIWGLPTARASLSPVARSPHVVFLGALDSRKGVTNLMAAWDDILSQVPAARLTVVGKGPLEDQVTAWAAERPAVTALIDPPRTSIRDVLAEGSVLFLLSQPSPLWKEQIGLPILEGLEYGLEIVASTETGIADWLRDHGHRVISPASSPRDVAAAVTEALVEGRTPVDVAGDLPPEDGRLLADRWLYER